MPKQATLIVIHGMGRASRNYSRVLSDQLLPRLGPLAGKLHIGEVFYQDLLQQRADPVWKHLARQPKWEELQQHLFFGMADLAALENLKDFRGSSYWLAQLAIAKEMLLAREAMNGDGPIMILAQSLGCHIASCYFWDAMQAANGSTPRNGIWRDIRHAEGDITGGRTLLAAEIDFLRGSTFRTLMTTGCIIPVFIAAHAKSGIHPIKPNNDFTWRNFHDKDDVFSWPMAELSPEYAALVTDHDIDVKGRFSGWFNHHRSPYSQKDYWSSDRIVYAVEQEVRQLLSASQQSGPDFKNMQSMQPTC